jgi:ribosomal protein S18 acetylase RimI-like enzyme
VKLAFHNDSVIGAVACRIESMVKTDPTAGIALYIMTLGVLAPYRNYGVGGRLLAEIITYAEATTSVKELRLHVQTSNDDAITFYKKRDFEITETIENYYKRIPPPLNCHVLTKKMNI